MTQPIIAPEAKSVFPDEILDRILKATEELVDKIAISGLAMIPKENLVDFVSTLANTMVIGASIALEYIDQKKDSQNE